jgi:SAM-dependent methyltransferase
MMMQKLVKQESGTIKGLIERLKLKNRVFHARIPENRTIEQLREHYEIEKELAGRLRLATGAERRYLYTSLYDELFRRVANHPQLTRKLSAEERLNAVSRELKRLKPFLNEEVTFLEVGAGDCALSLAAANSVKKVYAVDVSAEITRNSQFPPNFQLVLSDGCNIPVSPGTVQVAYSNQLMEHLHPDDASEQLHNIYEALAPGGVYLCMTPNRLSGPHDISQYFERVATGFHLKEYTLSELNKQFKAVGFTKVRVYLGLGENLQSFSIVPFILLEGLLNLLPYRLRKLIACRFPTRMLLGIRLIGTK